MKQTEPEPIYEDYDEECAECGGEGHVLADCFPESGARRKNSNYPKCQNCQELGCDAGMVNHVFHGKKRRECLLCHCGQFLATEDSGLICREAHLA